MLILVGVCSDFIFDNKKAAGISAAPNLKQRNYLTSSLNDLPADQAGTVLAAIFNSLPV